MHVFAVANEYKKKCDDFHDETESKMTENSFSFQLGVENYECRAEVPLIRTVLNELVFFLELCLNVFDFAYSDFFFGEIRSEAWNTVESTRMH